MKTKFKRALFGMMAGIMVANTPLTVLADYQPMSEYKNEQKTDSIESDTMRDGHEKPFLERENLYQYLTELKEEDRAKLLTELSEEEIYELVILLQYEYVNTFSQEQSLELYKEVVDDYWKSMPELKTDKEKKEYVSKLSKWHEKAFEYVDTKEKTEESYLEALYKDKIYAKEMLNLFAEYLDKSEEDSVSEDTELKEMRKAKEEALEEAYKELKDSVFPVENKDSSEDTTEIPKEDKPEVTPEIPSEEVKPDASDETTVETERQPDSTGNAETPEQSSEEVTTPENTPEETPEEVDLSLSKKELKKLMKSKTFSIEKFSKRMYESRNFYPIYATFKSSKKESFLGSRTETELYQIMLMSKYTLLQQYLKYASTGVDKTDMADLGMYLSDYQMILKQWIITSTAEGTHLTQEEKDVLNVDILNILKESDHLEVTDFAGYEEYLKNLESKIDVSVLLEAFGKIDLTSDDTLSNSIGELTSTSYKLFQMEEEMNGSAVETTPAMEKRNRVMAVAERASNGQEVSVAEGMYYFTAYTSNMAMQVEGNGTANMTNVCLRPTTNTANNRCEQKWIIIKRSDGWYKILSNYSRKSLDLYGGSSENYQNIDLYEDNNSDSQCWKFYYCDGRYVVKSKIGTVLDVPNANFTSGTNIQSHEQNNSNAQQWTLSKVTDDTVYLKPGNSSNGHGYTASAPVNNMHDAYERLQYSGGTIMLMDQWDTTTTITLTGTSYTNSVAKSVNLVNGCTLGFKRYSGFTSAKSMFSAGSGSLTFKNLTFDGNSGNVKKVRAIIYSEIALNIDHCNFQNSDTNNSAAFIIATKNLTATNCTFKSSHSTRTDQNNTIGGVWLNNNTVGTFTDCNFSENRENSMVLVYYSKGIFKRCNFTNNGVNKSSGYGSAIGSNAGDVELYNCTFEKNYSIYDGGAIHINNNVQQSHDDNRAHFYAEGCTFTNNSSGRNSGAIMLYDTGQTATIKNCKFNKNSASNFAGAIGSYESTDLTLTGNTFSGNSATEGGGAVYNGAKLTLTPNGSTADSFKSNTAQKGGAICHNGTFFKMVGGSTIDTGNDVFLSTGKYITVPSALSSSFAARVTPEEYESGRVVVRNTYGVKGSTIKSKFTLTPSGGFYLLGGDMYTGANSADVILAKGFTITYNANGGTGAPAAQSKGTGESVKISSTKPTKSGYTFKNWNTLIGGNGITYNPGDTYSENADLNLYAQWTSSGSSGGGSTATKYTLTYNPNGGSVYPTSKQLAAGEKYGTLPTPTRSGHTFNGWYTSATGGSKVSETTKMGSYNTTIYAHWAANAGTGGGETTTKYTLTYNANGGSVYPTSKQLAAGEKYGTLPTPTRSGYTFTGWYTSTYGSTKVSENTTMGSSNTTIYAHWTSSGSGGTTTKYTLTYNANGGSVYPTSKQLAAGEKYGTLPIPKREGYTFDGWYTSPYSYFATKVSADTVMGSFNVTIYAHWTENVKTYTVKYNGNGNTGGSTASSTHTVGVAKNLTANGFTRTGYAFAGWNTSANGNGTSYADKESVKDLSTTNGATVTLYAKWTPREYQLTMNPNGGEFADGNTNAKTLSPNLIYDGTNWHNVSSNTVSRTGYTFDGWYDKATGGEKVYNTDGSCISGTYWKNSTYKYTGNLTVYAHWTAKKYTVTYNSNGGSGSMATDTVTYGTAYRTKANQFTKTGYTFVGWNEKANGTGSDWTSWIGKDWTWTYTKNVTLYAQWRVNSYTLNITGDSGVEKITGNGSYSYGVTANVTYKIKTGYHITSTSGTTVDGNPDGSWTDKAGAEGAVNDSWEIKTCDRTIVVHTAPNTYTVKYNGNGNNGGSTANSTHTYDVAKNLTKNGFVKTGYTFKGWNTKADGSGTSYADKASVKNLSSTNGATITLYAQWTANKYTVAYNANGGTGTMATDTVSYGTDYVTKTNAFTRTGYTFKGWNEKADGTGTDWTNWIGKSWTWTYTKNITLYAQWTANQYQLTLNPNNGSFSDGTTVAKTLNPDLIYNGYNWCDISSQKVSRTGYTFDGWYDKASGGEKVYDVNGSCVTGTYWKNNIYQHTGNLTVYAHWAPKSVVVTFHRNASSSDTVTAQQTFTYDKAGQKFTDKGWTKKGYTLLGWSDSKDAATATYPITCGVSNEWINGRYPKTDLYAVWKANTYTIKYNGNGNDGGSTASSTHTVDLVKNLTVNGFTKTGYTFIGWNTKADGTGTPYKDQQSVKNLAYENGATVTLYAQWSANKYIVVFNANGGTGKMEDQEMIYDKATALRANTFTRVGYRFNGWNTRADGTGTTYADKATVKNLAEKAESRVILYARWHSAPPELEAKDATYYEGQEITKKDLLKNVTKAFDAEDGDVTGKVKIVKIEYAAGKLVDGKEQPGYVSEWKDGMPDGEKLDTWFMQLPKEKAPVTHKITYQVTDLSGKTTTKTSSILVKYNEFPVITGVDRYFTLADAKAGKITEDVLLKDAIKSGKLKSDDKEEGVISNKITILDYKDTDFKNVNGNATVTVVFKVTDSMGPGGVGKETIYEIKVKIIDPESNYWRDDDESASRKKVRFITKKYYDKNKDLDYRDMSSEAIEASSDNGGLNVMSKWYQNADYKALLTGTFEKETGTEYKIDSEKAKKLKEKIETDGIGNSKRDNALTDIYNSLK